MKEVREHNRLDFIDHTNQKGEGVASEFGFRLNLSEEDVTLNEFVDQIVRREKGAIRSEKCFLIDEI